MQAGGQQESFITCHNIQSLEYLEIWEPGDAKMAIKMHSDRYGQDNQYLGFTHQVKIQGVSYWIKDEVRRQRVPAVANFTALLLVEAIKNCRSD